MATKASIATTDTASSPNEIGRRRSPSAVRSSARSSATSPMARAATPAGSRRAFGSRSNGWCTNRHANAMASSTNGTFTANTQRQLAASVSAPPISGPSALPTPMIPMISPPAMTRRAAGRAPNVRPRQAGHMTALPTAVAARAARSTSTPGASAATTDAAAKTPAPIMNSRRRPCRSANRPAKTISTASTSE